jgi:short-subunit dehydrogenase
VATVLVTGANRGIGLQLCSQFAARGDDVIAVCRETTHQLSALDVRVIDSIDVGSGAAVETLRQELDGQPIDILVNNAGILLRDAFGDIDYDLMIEHYRINTLGPLRVTEALADNLHEGSKVAIVSSRVGSIERQHDRHQPEARTAAPRHRGRDTASGAGRHGHDERQRHPARGFCTGVDRAYR